jgi:hypothetical protein
MAACQSRLPWKHEPVPIKHDSKKNEQLAPIGEIERSFHAPLLTAIHLIYCEMKIEYLAHLFTKGWRNTNEGTGKNECQKF